MKKLILFLSLYFFNSQIFAQNSTWSQPFLISQSRSYAFSIAVDSQSKSLAVFLDDYVGSELFSSTLPKKSYTWKTPVLISSVTSGFLHDSHAYIDAMDRQIALWKHRTAFASYEATFKCSRRDSHSEPWSAPISKHVAEPIYSNLFAVSNQGAALLSWVTKEDGENTPYVFSVATQFPNETDWSDNHVLFEDTCEPFLVDSVISGNIGYITWVRIEPEAQTAKILAYNLNKETYQILPNVPVPENSILALLKIASDSSGNLITFYTIYKFDFGFQTFVTILPVGSKNWSNPIQISKQGNAGISLDVKMNNKGSAILLWLEWDTDSNLTPTATEIALNGTILSKKHLSEPMPAFDSFMLQGNLAIDSFGNTVGTWCLSENESAASIRVAVKPFGKPWKPSKILTTEGTFPVVTLNKYGTALLAWKDLLTDELFGSKNLYLFPLPPPTFAGTILSNRLLTETQYALRMQWEPPSGIEIKKYEIRHNGELLAVFPGDGPFNFQVDLPSKKAEGIYTLTSVAANGNRSDPIPLIIR